MTATDLLTPQGEGIPQTAQVAPARDDVGGMTTDLRPAPRLTAADVKAALDRLRGVVVLDLGDWTVYPIPEGLTADEAEDPTLVVLVDHDAAAAAMAVAGRHCDAARLLTRQLADQHRRGLL